MPSPFGQLILFATLVTGSLQVCDPTSCRLGCCDRSGECAPTPSQCYRFASKTSCEQQKLCSSGCCKSNTCGSASDCGLTSEDINAINKPTDSGGSQAPVIIVGVLVALAIVGGVVWWKRRKAKMSGSKMSGNSKYSDVSVHHIVAVKKGTKEQLKPDYKAMAKAEKEKGTAQTEEARLRSEGQAALSDNGRDRRGIVGPEDVNVETSANVMIALQPLTPPPFELPNYHPVTPISPVVSEPVSPRYLNPEELKQRLESKSPKNATNANNNNKGKKETVSKGVSPAVLSPRNMSPPPGLANVLNRNEDVLLIGNDKNNTASDRNHHDKSNSKDTTNNIVLSSETTMVRDRPVMVNAETQTTPEQSASMLRTVKIDEKLTNIGKFPITQLSTYIRVVFTMSFKTKQFCLTCSSIFLFYHEFPPCHRKFVTIHLYCFSPLIFEIFATYVYIHLSRDSSFSSFVVPDLFLISCLNSLHMYEWYYHHAKHLEAWLYPFLNLECLSPSHCQMKTPFIW
eukprot:TRINITY_DN6161_c0_g1_i9.p1 TRINITY_DN6161_c0_g1~~TRINITY_DN6161_c0_g1_i9.p1  ORF type:complete len:512 (-),score=47.37 TRINITY_DN6161_c0_g1_i9:311-1846(-)